MNYQWIEDSSVFERIAQDWDRALLCSKEDNPFLLSDFIQTWWKYYAKGSKLQIFVLYDGKNIIGGLPLYHKKEGYLEYPGGCLANYTEFLTNGNNQQQVWGTFLAALDERKDWRCVSLKRYRKNRCASLQEFLREPFHYNGIWVDSYKCGYTYLINIPENFSNYIDFLPKKLRYYIRRSEKEFSKLGKITFSSLHNHDELLEWYDTFIRLSRDSFKRRNKISAFEDERQCEFFKELINKFYRAGYLDLNVLKLNDRVIAIHFGYSTGKNLNYVFPVFDMDFAPLNPGHLLIYRLIELGTKRGNKLFDFYSGHSFYKEQWSQDKEDMLIVEIRRKNTRNRIERYIGKKIRGSLLIDKLKEKARGFPGVVKVAKKVSKLI